MRRWTIALGVSACAVVLLGLAIDGRRSGLGAAAVDPLEALRAKLDQPVGVAWTNVPLDNALADLSQRTGVPIHIDQASLAAQRISPAQWVTLNLFGARLRSVLHLLLDDRKLTYVPSGEGLTVTSQQVAAERLLVGRLYEVADMTRQKDSFTEERLGNVIRSMIAADQWAEAGGNGKIDVRPGALLIEQTWTVHEQIANLLEELRRPADPADDLFGSCFTPQTTAIYKALDARITVGPGDTLAGALRGVMARHGINFVVKWHKLREEDNVLESSAQRTTLNDVTLRSLLDVLLPPLGLGWTVKHDVLVITTREDADTTLLVRSYPRLGVFAAGAVRSVFRQGPMEAHGSW